MPRLFDLSLRPVGLMPRPLNFSLLPFPITAALFSNYATYFWPGFLEAPPLPAAGLIFQLSFWSVRDKCRISRPVSSVWAFLVTWKMRLNANIELENGIIRSLKTNMRVELIEILVQHKFRGEISCFGLEN